MDIQKLIQNGQSNYQDDQKGFFAYLGYQLLDQSAIFTLLDCASEVKNNLKHLLEDKTRSHKKGSGASY